MSGGQREKERTGVGRQVSFRSYRHGTSRSEPVWQDSGRFDVSDTKPSSSPSAPSPPIISHLFSTTMISGRSSEKVTVGLTILTAPAEYLYTPRGSCSREFGAAG